MLHRHRASSSAPKSSSGLLASPALCRLVTHFVLHPQADLQFHGLKRDVVQADVPRWRALREMIWQFVEPADVLRVALANVAGIEVAFVYGSFAGRHNVNPNSDVDVFVVFTQIDQSSLRTAVAAELLEVSGLLHREVNASRYTPSKLAGKIAEHSRFIATVLAGEKVWVIGSPAVLAAEIRRSTAPPTSAEPRMRYGAHFDDRVRS